MKRYGLSPGNTSRSCCTTHAGVGSRVTLPCRILSRRCSMMKKHESSWKVKVGTVKKSQATIASRWLARKADQRVAESATAWHASQIPGDAAFGDVEAELQEFPMDP